MNSEHYIMGCEGMSTAILTDAERNCVKDYRSNQYEGSECELKVGGRTLICCHNDRLRSKGQ